MTKKESESIFGKRFRPSRRLCVEPDADTSVSINICLTLNKLLGFRIEFEKQKNSDFKENPMICKGIPNHTYLVFSNNTGKIIFTIEIKQNFDNQRFNKRRGAFTRKYLCSKFIKAIF
ncbi:35832_t:CDS:2 [Gigaspora margarita]|uniref:35832_t:CDS:1 n=1 Tax=Gigaspora margarita TaxID=4874 RepID=A0ABN7USW9_GIGMA|nr:35832_t:CDS:2 [Gigaspora margarita]